MNKEQLIIEVTKELQICNKVSTHTMGNISDLIDKYTDTKVNKISSSPMLADSASTYPVKLHSIAAEIEAEVLRAKTLFPNNFVNQHEAYAVILEEVDELWDEIKKNQRNYDLYNQRKEATQAAAMLMRLIVELL